MLVWTIYSNFDFLFRMVMKLKSTNGHFSHNSFRQSFWRLYFYGLLNVKFSKANLHLITSITFILQAFSITFFGEWGDKSQVSNTQGMHCLSVSHYYMVNHMLLSLIFFSASYHWFGCRWEPIWCCSWWNSVSYAYLSILSIGVLLMWTPSSYYPCH